MLKNIFEMLATMLQKSFEMLQKECDKNYVEVKGGEEASIVQMSRFSTICPSVEGEKEVGE